MRTRILLCAAVSAGLSIALSATVSAAPTFFGPSPYLSSADIPAGFYAGGAPDFLENFEDSMGLDGTAADGFLESNDGVIIPPTPNPPVGPNEVDSVDGDDGMIGEVDDADVFAASIADLLSGAAPNGAGGDGHSYFTQTGAFGIKIFFNGLVKPTAFALVWTDGAGDPTFSAFDKNNAFSGSFSPPSHADSSVFSTVGEDRFYGVKDPNGIGAIQIQNTIGGLEIDHVQYGQGFDETPNPIPEPSSLVLLGVGGLGLALIRRRRKKSAEEETDLS